jgi:hypothetical protein
LEITATIDGLGNDRISWRNPIEGDSRRTVPE